MNGGFSEWANNPRTVAMFEREANVMELLKQYREALVSIARQDKERDSQLTAKLALNIR